MSTHNLCFEQKYEKQSFFVFFLSEKFKFLEVKFSINLKRHVFIMAKVHGPKDVRAVEV